MRRPRSSRPERQRRIRKLQSTPCDPSLWQESTTVKPRQPKKRLYKMDRMKRALAAFCAYCALTIALTYPLIRQLASAIPNDAGDPALNTWILWWNAQAIPFLPAWWNAPSFFPGAGTLAFSENLLGLSVIATPIQWLGFSPQVAYNTVLLL